MLVEIYTADFTSAFWYWRGRLEHCFRRRIWCVCVHLAGKCDFSMVVNQSVCHEIIFLVQDMCARYLRGFEIREAKVARGRKILFWAAGGLPRMNRDNGCGGQLISKGCEQPDRNIVSSRARSSLALITLENRLQFILNIVNLRSFRRGKAVSETRQGLCWRLIRAAMTDSMLRRPFAKDHTCPAVTRWILST